MSDSQPASSPTNDSDIIRRGYDDRANTSRAHLQRQRQHINHEIFKELRIRSGAEKMLKATTSGNPSLKGHHADFPVARRDSGNGAKLQEMIALELGVVNARLQLLSEQLAEVNSQVSRYQNVEQSIPMVPIGLKETVEVNEEFTRIIQRIIQQHFYITDDDDELTSPTVAGPSGRIKNSPHVEPTINAFLALREACRKPMRDENGVRMLYESFNQLCLIERRFFAGNVDEMVEFQWYDSLTGIPFSQKSLAFEKGATLFNIAALHTQIGAAQDRTARDGLAIAAEQFCRAAGLFEYIAKSFKYAPSMDMRNATLESFKELMIAQAHECLYAKMLLSCGDDEVDAVIVNNDDRVFDDDSHFARSGVSKFSDENVDADIDSMDESSGGFASHKNIQQHGFVGNNKKRVDADATGIHNGREPGYAVESSVSRLVYVAQQASRVSKAYASVRDSVNTTIVKEYFPSSWISLILVKMQHYRSLGHYYFGQAVMSSTVQDEAFGDENIANNNKENARNHFRQATLLQEEAIRTHEMCKHLRQVDLLFDFLRRSHELALNALCDTEREDDLSDPAPVSAIAASTTTASGSGQPLAHNRSISDSTNNSAATSSATASSSLAHATADGSTLPVLSIYPSFTQYKVRDMFAGTLGPLAFFNCLNNWSPPKEVRLTRDAASGFGFSIRGSAPVSISDVEKGSVAQAANLQVGDLIIEVNGQDARSALHEEVVALIRASGQRLTLKTITMTRTSQATTATLNRRIARQQEKKDRSSQAASRQKSSNANNAAVLQQRTER